ncbi:UDP-N-acetylglucosamine 1-carboxyvinyltransferase [Anaerofilum sp. BX8]|uniref:UDP-N-acetylglucosamine 1-carboxyvinyltransferase n=1 Tax=Anaerofilum hominis TaxID=2763016 RepID=A0A923IF29_9FIRM|nr:UDP-N-acetylglucosamine 1-carboxyvinyltransferase [Anaerofilum hominis]
MDKIVACGGLPLFGEVEMPTAKNSILPILAAAVLAQGPVRIRRAPLLRDVDTSLQLLAALGCPAVRTGGDLLLAPGGAVGDSVPPKLMAAMRSSIYYLAPMLARGGRARITFPGGCRLGARPIDIHLEGLAAMGAEISRDGEELDCAAPRGLHGAQFHLHFPSVGATETLMMAAAAASGVSVLTGAAREPEVVDLAGFLNACGARVEGAGSGRLVIRGGALHGCDYTPIPDRITAQTVLCAAAACGGAVTLRRAPFAPLQPLAGLLQRAGCTVRQLPGDGVRIEAAGRLAGLGRLETGVYPAFATDAGPLLAAAMLTADGGTALRETIFTNRFACAAEFARMGAQAEVEQGGGLLRIRGVSRLQGARLEARDLRGGAALVIAALAAQGESEITGVEFIRRGYEDIAGLFRALGAQVDSRPQAEAPLRQAALLAQ